jgi:hypothetical protein
MHGAEIEIEEINQRINALNERVERLDKQLRELVEILWEGIQPKRNAVQNDQVKNQKNTG